MTKTTSTNPAVSKAKETGVFTNEPHGTFVKRIGYTVYHVGVHFSDTSVETARDKILRLIVNEAATEKATVNQ